MHRNGITIVTLFLTVIPIHIRKQEITLAYCRGDFLFLRVAFSTGSIILPFLLAF